MISGTARAATLVSTCVPQHMTMKRFGWNRCDVPSACDFDEFDLRDAASALPLDRCLTLSGEPGSKVQATAKCIFKGKDSPMFPSDLFSRHSVSRQVADCLASALPILIMTAALGCSDDVETPLAPTETPAGMEAAAAAATWQHRADYPTNIYGPVSAAYTNPSTQRTTLYVIGGGLKIGGPAGSLTDAVWAYDVSANRWSPKAKLPVVLRSAHQAVQVNGKIYVAGGFSRRWDPKYQVWRLATSKALYEYDIVRNAWTREADMPGTGVQGVAAAYNGFIYIATQCYDTLCGADFKGAVIRYNLNTDRWSLQSRVPNGETSAPAGGIIGGKLYVV